MALMKIHTETSIYEFDVESKLCRRLPVFESELRGLRKDEEWVKYYDVIYEVGKPMTLVLEHLGGDSSGVTFRNTTLVVKVEQ